MINHAHARPSRISEDAEFNDRFWFWQGASGKTYIHSVYRADACPPLPGAIYIAVQRNGGGSCTAVSAGRLDDFSHLSSHGADELHVHMLAKDNKDSTRILQDLKTALFAVPQPQADDRELNGFHEPQLALFTGQPAAVAAC